MSLLRSAGIPFSGDDRGVSAVIGVILMVAITVAIAATVYIWAGGFGETSEGPEDASATAQAVSLDSNNDDEWIKFTLTAGSNAPYSNSSVGVSVSTTGSTAGTWNHLCETPETGTAPAGCTEDFTPWEVGSAKWFPCLSSNRHSISLAVEGTAILDRTIQCEESES